jgi:DNA-binding IscR family transcriptional regulator
MHLLDCVGIENVCVIQPGCKLKTVLAKAERIQMEYLQSVTLSDLLTPGVTLLQIRESGKRGQRTEDRGQNGKIQGPKSKVRK